MDATDRQSLLNNAVLIGKDLEVDGAFLSHFAKDQILSPEMMDEIEAMPSKPARARKFASIIPKRGQKAYGRLIEALMETGQEHIADSLCPTRVQQWRLQSGQSSTNSPPSRRKIRDEGKADIEIDVLNVDENSVRNILESEEAYSFKSKPRGRAIILNNETFDKLKKRTGSTVDANNLEKLYSRLGFQTVIWKDLKAKEIKEYLDRERKHEMHKNADAFIFTILSHGVQGNIHGFDGELVELTSLYAMVDGKACPSLINKPKIFIIQACQGNLGGNSCRLDGDTDTLSVASKAQETICSRDTMDAIPVVHEKADLVVATSTVPGYKSWRHTELGSLFIRYLIYTFMERCHVDDLADMLREVNRKHTAEGKNQICLTTEITRKKIFFLPGYYEK